MLYIVVVIVVKACVGYGSTDATLKLKQSK